MKKFSAIILALMLLCGVLSACGNGNISNDKNGMATDSPNDAEDIIDDGDMTDDGILDGDKGGNSSNNGGSNKGSSTSNNGGDTANKGGANDGGKDSPVSSSMPGESPAVATQTVTP